MGFKRLPASLGSCQAHLHYHHNASFRTTCLATELPQAWERETFRWQLPWPCLNARLQFSLLTWTVRQVLHKLLIDGRLSCHFSPTAAVLADVSTSLKNGSELPSVISTDSTREHYNTRRRLPSVFSKTLQQIWTIKLRSSAFGCLDLRVSSGPSLHQALHTLNTLTSDDHVGNRKRPLKLSNTRENH